jgi:hypothetical protein
MRLTASPSDAWKFGGGISSVVTLQDELEKSNDNYDDSVASDRSKITVETHSPTTKRLTTCLLPLHHLLQVY